MSNRVRLSSLEEDAAKRKDKAKQGAEEQQPSKSAEGHASLSNLEENTEQRQHEFEAKQNIRTAATSLLREKEAIAGRSRDLKSSRFAHVAGRKGKGDMETAPEHSGSFKPAAQDSLKPGAVREGPRLRMLSDDTFDVETGYAQNVPHEPATVVTLNDPKDSEQLISAVLVVDGQEQERAGAGNAEVVEAVVAVQDRPCRRRLVTLGLMILVVGITVAVVVPLTSRGGSTAALQTQTPSSIPPSSSPPSSSPPSSSPPSSSPPSSSPPSSSPPSSSPPSSSPPTTPSTPTPSGIVPPNSTVTKFYVMGGQNSDPFLPNKLSQIENDIEWLVHVGDFGRPSANCSTQSYMDYGQVLSQSSARVFMLPGEKEWNNCMDPDKAWEDWISVFGSFETKHWPAPTGYIVSRQSPFGVARVEENFAFTYKSVLHVGINLVGGTVQDSDEWNDRLQANLEWITENVNAFRSTVSVLVIYGNSGFENEDSRLATWYQTLTEKVNNEYLVDTFVVHETSSVGSATLTDEKPHFNLLQFKGGLWPPLKVTVNATVDGWSMALG